MNLLGREECEALASAKLFNLVKIQFGIPFNSLESASMTSGSCR
jgi:hypothetical protein